MYRYPQRMISLRSLARGTALLASVLFCAAACERKTPPALASPPPQVVANTPGITFRKGFYQQEDLTPTVALRWAHQDTIVHVDVPTDGRYQLTFRAFTVFSMLENTIEITIGDQPAGKFATHAFDLAEAVPTPVQLTLHAGGNDLHLHSTRPEARLGENDERLAAYGILLPVTLEPVVEAAEPTP